MMRAYELMVIIDGDVEDAKAQSWTKFVADEIVKAGGSVHGKPDWWGKRAFAYPINKKEAGYYLVVECVAAGGALDELERQLRLADDIVRHKLIRLPDAEAARRGMAVNAAMITEEAWSRAHIFGGLRTFCVIIIAAKTILNERDYRRIASLAAGRLADARTP